ncbi:DUF2591 family protein [Morganella morganii subsp. morganii]|uniref:phage protein NinX family protein n=1 Tax=Morganella morganii TaxID=582 RepID=UPI000DFF9243|nr:phage protein NinX family protein [Morganella morganii]ELA8473782.1 DUF2591 family protein [Morganella morganii]MBC3999747.1 DUF2591 family protein [Morganella morganii]MBT0350201.1 DUF2591 family protein [Morganella morganii subsp. morganii]MBT0375150.1 DUF2591 family protein [Morganella morganii subsp. morganii]MBT0447242.1 DUF2591 family protein [Morganella morganii subsp. morganii]
MNKYRDKSDFEINKAVAVNVNGADAVVEKFGRIYIIDEDGIAMVSFDPCNNPADAWPIINEYGISLIYQEREFQFATNDGNIECSISNPLKAAMIIFLMMKEAENES